MLTRGMQIQAIADLLGGSENGHLRTQDFDEPWRTALRVVLNPPPEGVTEGLRGALSGHPDFESVMGAILATEPGAQLEFESLRAMANRLEPIRWLWPE